MKHITLEMLEQAKVSPARQELFKNTFGLRAELTTANMAKALEAGLGFDWLAPLLPQPIREAFEEQHLSLWKTYDALAAPLWKVHEAQRMLLWKDYKAQRDTLLLSALLAA